MRTLGVMLASVAGSLLAAQCSGATIGGDEVPSHLHCNEDEVIGYHPDHPGPRSLVCINYEVLEAR